MWGKHEMLPKLFPFLFYIFDFLDLHEFVPYFPVHKCIFMVFGTVLTVTRCISATSSEQLVFTFLLFSQSIPDSFCISQIHLSLLALIKFQRLKVLRSNLPAHIHYSIFKPYLNSLPGCKVYCTFLRKPKTNGLYKI